MKTTDGSAAARWGVLAAFAAVYVIWGSTYLAIHFAIETLPPFLMAGTRFLVAGGVLYLFVRLRGAARPSLRHWRSATVVGALLLLGGNGLVVWAEQWVPSGIAALLVSTLPFWMVAIEWLRPRGVRPTGTTAVGLVIGFGGIVLLVGPADGSAGFPLFGAVALVAASLSWALGSIYARGADLPDSPLVATAMEMLAGGALLTVVGIGMGEVGRFDPDAVSVRSLAALLYLIVFGSLVAFSAYIWLLGVSTPARVSTYAYVNPVVAVVLGWALAGEALTLRTLLAMAVIVGAVAVITTQRAAAPSTPASPPGHAGRAPQRRWRHALRRRLAGRRARRVGPYAG